MNIKILFKYAFLIFQYQKCFWQENKYNETNVKYTRIHVYEYTERMFATNLPYRDRKPKYTSKF